MLRPKAVWRATPPILALIAISAAILRVWPLVRWGAWRVPVDYDEGVYSSAAQLLFGGVLPYRDFTFVHPPGFLYFLGTTALLPRLDPSEIYAASRFVSALLGAFNVVLVGALAWRWRGMVAGVLAAVLYATYPEAVIVERGVFLEPVLNVACLAAATLWLRNVSRSGAWATGLFLGYAISVKLTGGVFLLAALAATPRVNWRTLAPHLVVATALTSIVLVAPLLLAAPENFFNDVVAFHLRRPPDGLVSRVGRLQEMLLGLHPVAGVLGLAGLVIAGRGFRLERAARLFFIGFALIATSFLGAATYWNQYDAFLAPLQTVLAGAAGAALWSFARRRGVGASVGAAVIMILFVVPSTRFAVLSTRDHDDKPAQFAVFARREISAQSCLFSFEPAWALAAGRLPFHTPEQNPVVDPYASMLLQATQGGRRFTDAAAAFESGSAREAGLPLMNSCPYLVLGWRGRWQLGASGTAHFTQINSELDVWQRITP